MTIASGNTVHFTSGTSTILSLSCQGELEITGGSFSVAGTASVHELKVEGASVFLNGTSTVYDLYLKGNSTAEGVLGGIGSLTITHYFDWRGATSGGILSSRITISGATVVASTATGDIYAPRSSGNVAPDGPVRLANVLENYGYLSVSGSILGVEGEHTLINRAGGTIFFGYGYTIISALQLLVQNYGLIERGGFGGVSLNSVYPNAGTIKTVGGEINISYIENTGRIEVDDHPLGESEGEIKFTNANMSIGAASVITGTGGVFFWCGNGFTETIVDGTYHVKDTYIRHPDALIKFPTSATVSMTNLTVENGRLELTEPLTLNNLTLQKFFADFDAGILTGAVPVTVNGIMTWKSGTMEGPADTIVNGTLNINGADTKYLGTGANYRPLYLNGTGTWSAGNINATGASWLTVNPGATLTAKGTLQGNLRNRGTLNVGGSSGVLNVDGNFIQEPGSTLNMEIGGPAAGQYDQLNVMINASLAGSLNLSLTGGYTLGSESFDILTYGGRSGQFTAHNLPAGAEYAYQANALTISGEPVPQNPVPVLTSIDPSGVAVGSPEFTLTVDGTGFILASRVNMTGDELTTVYISATRLTAAVPAGKVDSLGAFPVTVVNPAPGGGTSNEAFLFTSETGAQVLDFDLATSTDPSGTAVASTAALTATASGTGSVLVAVYDSNPGGALSFTSGGSFMDVSLEPRSCLHLRADRVLRPGRRK